MPRTKKKTKPKARGQCRKHIHPLTPAVDFITENMGPMNRRYWTKEANRKSISLRSMVAQYLVQDFQIKENHEIL